MPLFEELVAEIFMVTVKLSRAARARVAKMARRNFRRAGVARDDGDGLALVNELKAALDPDGERAPAKCDGKAERRGISQSGHVDREPGG